METQTKENDKWEGRYYVDLVASEYRDYENVNFRLFQPEMQKEEAAELLKPFGFNEDNEYYLYIVSHVEQTFSLDQVMKLVDYFGKWNKTTIYTQLAVKPRERIAGVGSIAVGGLQDFYMFSDQKGYPLDFKVWGFYDLEDREPSYPKKVHDLAKKVNLYIAEAADDAHILQGDLIEAVRKNLAEDIPF